MLERRQLSVSEAQAAMVNGEFDNSVKAAAPRVAIILTQSWCPQWPAMEKWMRSLQRGGKPAEHEIIVFDFVYDRVDFAREFTAFKERVLGNSLIPYVRYYRNGTLVHESNYIDSRGFLQVFS
ncbi:MAG: hypothetical protein EA384_03505 [Spirochaetaceae bacterium]|nr:MAG: hypothetical protein EA384_03505 [Spirochaetaceae bacterium]